MNQWAIEYSVQENAFHIDPLEAVNEKNVQIIKRGMTPEYVIIDIAHTYEKALKLSGFWKKIIEDWGLRNENST